MLFALFVAFLAIALGFALFSAGALLGNRPRKQSDVRVPIVQLPTLPSLPPPPTRYARGTTPEPLSTLDQTPRTVDQTPRGVISNREDATDPDIDPDARFSVRRSSQRL